jgi:hypothetical protein
MRALVRISAASVLDEYAAIPAVRVRMSPAAALVLRRHPMVDYITPRAAILSLDGAPLPTTCPLPSQVIPWNITKIGANQAWSFTRGDLAKTAVLLDDGVDEGNGRSPGAELRWNTYSIHATGGGPFGEGHHGTPVAGPIVAGDNSVGTVGVSPASYLWIAKVLVGDSVRYDVIPSAIEGAQATANVMNMSFSTKLFTADPPPYLTAVYDAIKVAYYQYGVTFVASTGNQASDSTYSYPARFPEVIGVGSSDETDKPGSHNYAPGNVDIVAPGVAVYTVCQGGGVASATGSSYATPHVAGAVMLLRALHPTWAPWNVWDRLRTTAVDIGITGRDDRTGWGRLDVGAAVRPPVRVTWVGMSQIRPTDVCTWAASVTSGEPPLSYRWHRNGDFIGTGSEYTGSMLELTNFVLNVTVTDVNGTVGSFDGVVTADPLAPPCVE